MKRIFLGIVIVIQLLSPFLVFGSLNTTDPSNTIMANGVGENEEFIVKKKKSGFELSLKKEQLVDAKLIVTSENGEVILQQKIGKYLNFFVSMHGFAKGNYSVKLVANELPTSELSLVWE